MSKEIHYRLVSQREERHVIPGAQVSLHGEPDGGTTSTSFTATPSSSADQSTTSQRRARSRTARKGRSTRTTDKHHSARRIVGQASAASSNTATPGEADRSRHSFLLHMTRIALIDRRLEAAPLLRRRSTAMCIPKGTLRLAHPHLTITQLVGRLPAAVAARAPLRHTGRDRRLVVGGTARGRSVASVRADHHPARQLTVGSQRIRHPEVVAAFRLHAARAVRVCPVTSRRIARTSDARQRLTPTNPPIRAPSTVTGRLRAAVSAGITRGDLPRTSRLLLPRAQSRQNKAVRQLFQSDRHASANASFQPTPFRPLAQSTPYVKTANSGLNRPTSGPAIPPRPTSAPPIPPRPAVASHSDPQASASTEQKDWHLESVTCEVDSVDVVNRPQSKIIKVRSSTSLVLRSPSDEGRKGPQRDRSRGSTVFTAKSLASRHPVANYRPPRRYHNGNPDSLPRYVPPNPNDPRRSAMSRVYYKYFAGLRPTPPVFNEAVPIHGFMADADPQDEPLARNRAARRLSFTNLPGSTSTPSQQYGHDPGRGSFGPFRPASAPPLESRSKSPANSGAPTRPRYVPPNPSDPRRSAMSRVYNNYFAGLRPTSPGASGYSQDFNPLTDTVPPINMNVSGSFFDPSRLPSSGWSEYAASPAIQPASVPSADSWDLSALNARFNARNTTRQLSFGDYVPSSYSASRLTSTSRPRGFADADYYADPHEQPRAGSRAVRLSFTDVRASPGPSNQQHGMRPTRPRYVPPNPNDPRRSAMSRVYRNYFDGLRPEPTPPNEALTLHGFIADSDPEDVPKAGSRARSAPPPETRPRSTSKSEALTFHGFMPDADPQDALHAGNRARSAFPSEIPANSDHNEHSVSSSQALGRTMSRLSLEDNRCVLDGPAMAYSNLKIQVDRKKNTTVLISRLVLNAVDRTKGTTKLTTRTRELPGTVVSTCEKSKQRNDGQAKTEQNIQIEKDKIVVERKTRLKDLQAGSDYTLEDTGTCRNVCQMRMAFGRSTTDGALNVASGVLISKDANGCVIIREMTRLYIGDTKENTSALVPLVSTVEMTPSKDFPSSLPPFFDENVQVGRSTIEIAREVRLDPQLIGSLNGRTTDSGFEEQRVYTPYEGKSDVHSPTNITPVSSAASFNASRRSVVSDPTQRSSSDQSVASSIHEHPYHGLAPRRSDDASRRRSSSDAQREMVASIPGVARSDTTRGTPELSSDSLSDSPASSRPPGQGRSRRAKSSHATSQEQQLSVYYSVLTSADPSRHHSQTNDSGTSKQSEGSKYLDVQLQTTAPSALHASSPHVGTAVAKSCHSVSERTALAARSASSITHSDKSEEQHSDRGPVSTAVSPSAHDGTVRSTYAASPASSQFVSPQPVQPLPSRTGNGTHLLYHTFNLPDVYLPNTASQIHEHRRVVQLQMVSNGEPLTVDLHATFRTRQPVLTLNLTDVSLDLWQK
ncbi:hypothetical protein AAVH_12357 [Aphelenchoides avenae]|nr:hypothetical protein AAVH_12357 [Aphelenchus avenae]